MKIAIVGTRGIPANYGGFETFAEEISRRLASNGMEVTVYCDASENQQSTYENVNLAYSSYVKSKNPLKFYYDCINLASKSHDILLVAGTGGSPFYWLPKLRKKKIITNIDGVESRRNKWSFLKKMYLKLSEIISIKFSDVIIADSIGIKDYVLENYNVRESKVQVIEYGAPINQHFDQQVLDLYGVKHNGYYLIVSRMEPENNVYTILEGYQKAQSDKPLIVVGNVTDSPYAQSLLKFRSDKIKFVGGIYDKDKLAALRYSCFAYMHGHSVGGTNPSLLEALGSGNISICHDNIFNREVTGSQMFYFSTSQDVHDIIALIESSNELLLVPKKQFAINRISSYYTWDNMAEKYRRIIDAM